MSESLPLKPRDSWKAIAAAVLLFVLAAIAYLPAMRAGFIWDDDSYILNNENLRSLGGLVDLWLKPGATPDYYPLTFTMFWVEHHLWGDTPLGYHLVNVLLHFLNGALLWRLLVKLRVPGALLAAALFLVHPVHVESVAWICERKNVLSGCLALLAFHVQLRAWPAEEAAFDWKRSRGWIVLSIALFALAMLAKTVVISFPFVFLLVRWWKRGGVTRQGVALAAIYFVAATPMVALGMWTQKHVVGATGAEFEMPFLSRVIVAGRAFWFYVGKLVWPSELTFIYPKWHIDPGQAGLYVFTAAALLLAVVLWLFRRRIGRAPFAVAACYALGLGPALGFFKIFWQRYSFVADHMQYFPSMSVFALTAAAIVLASRRLARNDWPGVAVVGAAVVMLGTLTFAQCGMYRDLETLWTRTIERNPECWMAYDHLAHIAHDKGDFAGAVRNAETALKIKPDFVDAHYNLGTWYADRGEPAEALPHYIAAVRLKPDSARIQNNLGFVLAQLGQLDEAIYRFREAVKLEPEYPGAKQNLQRALDMQNLMEMRRRSGMQ